MNTPENFNPEFAHIRDGNYIFQVLNADGTDWDEAATAKAYAAYRAGLTSGGGAGT